MNPIETINPKHVHLFKRLLHGMVESSKDVGLEFHLLDVATAAEEFAQELRQQAAERFQEESRANPPFPEQSSETPNRPQSYPDLIG